MTHRRSTIIIAFTVILIGVLLITVDQMRRDRSRQPKSLLTAPSPLPQHSPGTPSNESPALPAQSRPETSPRPSSTSKTGAVESSSEAQVVSSPSPSPLVSPTPIRPGLLPAIYAGDRIALPLGFGVFTVPQGVTARIQSPAVGVGTALCSTTIIPPCKLEWPIVENGIQTGLMRAEFAWCLDEAGRGIDVTCRATRLRDLAGR